MESETEETQPTGMTPEEHIAWYFHDVMTSWAGKHTWLNYARACAQFPPDENHLPKEFRDALLRLVAIWADR